MDWFREVENRDLPCHLFGYILDAEEANGLYETLDVYFSGLGDGEAELEIPVAPGHYNSANIVHGGVYSALMDAAMGMAMMTKNKMGVTTSLNVQYLKSAGKGDVLKAFAKVEKDGAHMVYCSCRVENQRGDLLATGQAALYVTQPDFIQYYAAKLRAEQQA